MDALLDRFCRYVRIDTQADEAATTYPSSPGQLELGRLLAEELRALGLRDAAQDEHGIVLATIPATVSHAAPTIAWIAHVDTSPETTGHNVKPIVHANYDGGDIVLARRPVPRHPRRRQSGAESTSRARRIITTDGTTLLGADDKAGVAVIMEAAAQLARPAGSPARPDPHLLHLRRGDRPRRRSRRSEETRRRRRLHARRRRPGRDRRRDLLRRPGRRHRARRQHPPVDRQGPHGQRGAPGRPLPRPPAARLPVAGNDRRPRRLPAPLPHRGRRRRDDDSHPAARLRHRPAGRPRRGAARRRPHGDGGVPAGVDRRANRQAVSQHGRRAEEGAARRGVRRRRRCGGPGWSRS